jgi:type I restriction enzyme, S subunit
MKNGWGAKELAAISAINYGYTESASSEPVGPRFLRITDIQNDRVDWESVPYCKIESTDHPKYGLASGDIVFARTGATTGKSFLVDDPPDAVFASYLIRLRVLDKKLLPEFVSLFFQTDGYWQSIKDGSSGSAQGGFNATKLGALRVPIPPLPEQRRIVGILDEAFEGIATAKANAEKNVHNAHALFQSHLNAIFTRRGPGWVEKPIAECFKVRSGDFLPAKTMVQTGDFDVYGGNGIAGKHDQKNLSGENIIIGRVGAKCGNVRHVKGDLWLTDNAFFIADYFQEFDHGFLARVLERKDLRRTANQAAQPVISYTTIKDVVLEFPSSQAKQRSIADKLNAIEVETQRLATLYERKLASLEALKKSLLHQAFTGEL